MSKGKNPLLGTQNITSTTSSPTGDFPSYKFKHLFKIYKNHY